MASEKRQFHQCFVQFLGFWIISYVEDALTWPKLHSISISKQQSTDATTDTEMLIPTNPPDGTPTQTVRNPPTLPPLPPIVALTCFSFDSCCCFRPHSSTHEKDLEQRNVWNLKNKTLLMWKCEVGFLLIWKACR
jgi:hypothetical protein